MTTLFKSQESAVITISNILVSVCLSVEAVTEGVCLQEHSAGCDPDPRGFRSGSGGVEEAVVGRGAVGVHPVPCRGGDGGGGVAPDPGVPARLGVYVGVCARGGVSRGGCTVHVEPPAQGPRRRAGNPNARYRCRQHRRRPRHQWVRRCGRLVIITISACFQFHPLCNFFQKRGVGCDLDSSRFRFGSVSVTEALVGCCPVGVPAMPGGGGHSGRIGAPDPGVPPGLGVHVGVCYCCSHPCCGGAIYVEPAAEGTGRQTRNPHPGNRCRQY